MSVIKHDYLESALLLNFQIVLSMQILVIMIRVYNDVAHTKRK